MKLLEERVQKRQDCNCFSNVTWYRNVYDAEKIEPYLINYSVKKGYSPVLVSAELFGRNFYAGSAFTPRVCIINNHRDSKDVPAGILEWKIVHQGKTLSSGTQNTETVPFYGRKWVDAKITLPTTLPEDKAYCKLILSLKSDGQTVSVNDYDILITNKNWLEVKRISEEKNIHVFDISGETYEILDFMNIKYQKLKDLTQMRLIDSDLLIIANLDTDEEVPYGWEDTNKIVSNGTNVLLIHPGKHMQWLKYSKIESIYHRKARIVNMHVPEHGAFDGIEPLELAWWQQEGRERPRAATRSYRLKKNHGMTSLATYIRPHTGLGGIREETYYEMNGTPLIELKDKKGVLIASEMEVNMGDKDPVAAKLLVNLINSLLD